MAERNILSNIVDTFTPSRPTSPAPNNLAAITFMQMQQDNNNAIQAEINNNQDTINAEYVVGMLKEFNNVYQAERSNPKENEGAAANYLYNNMGNIESRYDYWAGKTDDVYYKKDRKEGYLGFDSRIAGIRAPLRDFNNKLERYKDTCYFW